MQWSKPQNRRSAVRNVFSIFAGVAGLSFSSSAKAFDLETAFDLSKADIERFGEHAELFRAFRKDFGHQLTEGMAHHAQKSTQPEVCLQALQAKYVPAAQEILKSIETEFAENTIASLTDSEKKLLTKILKDHGPEVGSLMGKVFKARSTAMTQMFHRLDSEMSTFAINFSGAGENEKKPS
ncbi:hypothetical protein [Pseudobdellovibrio exovorus]|uniref:DUF4142 domain-containing protein n=1 Tax=Pseudobdellovibrio exovorus JSS TaxID=1184267 RepID=M4VE79_9BACT|nr:hypothetical protein [Pseudobdellovibrio exovorus]AGH96800.1 hypothetical protein A11Q_2584 [Pseudobdellovibrio exovorus JSS]